MSSLSTSSTLYFCWLSFLSFFLFIIRTIMITTTTRTTTIAVMMIQIKLRLLGSSRSVYDWTSDIFPSFSTLLLISSSDSIFSSLIVVGTEIKSYSSSLVSLDITSDRIYDSWSFSSVTPYWSVSCCSFSIASESWQIWDEMMYSIEFLSSLESSHI